MEYEELIKHYKVLRKGKKVSQVEAARIGNISPFAISRAEQLIHSPSLKTFIEMAKGIGYCVVLAPIYHDSQKREIIEKIVEVEKKQPVNYDNWKYTDDK